MSFSSFIEGTNNISILGSQFVIFHISIHLRTLRRFACQAYVWPRAPWPCPHSSEAWFNMIHKGISSCSLWPAYITYIYLLPFFYPLPPSLLWLRGAAYKVTLSSLSTSQQLYKIVKGPVTKSHTKLFSWGIWTQLCTVLIQLTNPYPLPQLSVFAYCCSGSSLPLPGFLRCKGTACPQGLAASTEGECQGWLPRWADPWARKDLTTQWLYLSLHQFYAYQALQLTNKLAVFLYLIRDSTSTCFASPSTREIYFLDLSPAFPDHRLSQAS